MEGLIVIGLLALVVLSVSVKGNALQDFADHMARKKGGEDEEKRD